MRLLCACSTFILCALFLINSINAQDNKNGLTNNYQNLNQQAFDSEAITLEEAVNKAVLNNPELKILRMEVNALEAVKIQNGKSPNPEFEFEAENILGGKDFNGFSGSEITVKISQNILLAGKINKREKVADQKISLAEWDYETKRLEIITSVKKAFQQANSSQLLIEKNRELIKISEEFISNLEKRVDAGKISPAEVSRARIIFNSLQIQLSRLQSQYDLAIAELESLIYEPNFQITSISGKLLYPVSLPDYETLLQQLENNPNLKRFKSENDMQNAIFELEKALAVPDLTLSAGYKRLNEANANTFLVGASIPLPLFDRNQGSIQEAQIRLDQKMNEYKSVKNKLIVRLNLLYKRFNTFLTIGNQLKETSIPEAEEAFRIIKEGNLVGRFAILDVLDAERTLFDLQNQYLNITSEIHSIKIEIEGLIAKEIN